MAFSNHLEIIQPGVKRTKHGNQVDYENYDSKQHRNAPQLQTVLLSSGKSHLIYDHYRVPFIIAFGMSIIFPALTKTGAFLHGRVELDTAQYATLKLNFMKGTKTRTNEWGI
jgi:hypothetical protein